VAQAEQSAARLTVSLFTQSYVAPVYHQYAVLSAYWITLQTDIVSAWLERLGNDTCSDN
jgi:hypothetical protein